MRRLESIEQAQRFVAAHAAVSNLFNIGTLLIRARHYGDPRLSAFVARGMAVA